MTDLRKATEQRLRAVRKAQRLSQQQLSVPTAGAVAWSSINNYEHGRSRMGVYAARSLAQALGTVSATHLLCLDDGWPLTQQEQNLLILFRRASDRGREVILAAAELKARTKTSE